MNPYLTFTQPWRSAFAVWAVMAQAQTEFTLRTMGMMLPRTAARRPSPAPIIPAAPTHVVLLDATAAPEPGPEPTPVAEVVPLRLVTEASASAIAAATAPEPEALPEPEPEVAPFVASEEPAEVAPAVLAQPVPAEDLVQAAVQSLVEAAGETPAALADLLPGTTPASPPTRRSATGARRGGRTKRGA
jgi:hypothetical protein